MTFLYVLLLLLGVFWLYRRFPPQVTVVREHAHLTGLGQEVEVQLHITVNALLPCRLDLLDEAPRTLILSQLLQWSGLVWGKHEQVIVSAVRPNKRGMFLWEGLNVRCTDPLGLFSRTFNVKVSSELVVYPQSHPLLMPELLRPLLLDGKRSLTLGMEDVSSLKGIRPYQTGDPLNRVHWKHTARWGTLMVREWEFMTTSHLHIHLHPDVSEVFTEHGVVLASSLIMEAMHSGLTVSVSGNGEISPPLPEEALLFLARYHPDPEKTTLPEVPQGSNVILISRMAPLELMEAALHARGRAAKVTLLVLPEGFYLAPGETGRKMWAKPPDEVQDLERKAGILMEAGIHVVVLRGNESILQIAEVH